MELLDPFFYRLVSAKDKSPRYPLIETYNTYTAKNTQHSIQSHNKVHVISSRKYLEMFIGGIRNTLPILLGIAVILYGVKSSRGSSLENDVAQQKVFTPTSSCNYMRTTRNIYSMHFFVSLVDDGKSE